MPKQEEILLIPGQRIRPSITKETSQTIVEKLYGIKVEKIVELNAYDDRNFHVLCSKVHNNSHLSCIEDHGYVLKIINSLDSKKTEVIDAQTELSLYLNDKSINCPLPIKNLCGDYYSLEVLCDDEKIEEENTENCEKIRYAVRLLTYQPGQLFRQLPASKILMESVGSFTARLGDTLKNFHHSAYDNHKTLWSLMSVPHLRDFCYAVNDPVENNLARDIIAAFEKEVLNEAYPELEQGIIHGDLNEQNIIVNYEGTDISAIIDFGDSHKTCLIFELAILLCYMILHAGDVAMGKYVIKGYQKLKSLNKLEKKILRVSVCARFCQSLVMGAYSYSLDPQNEYLLSTQKNGWICLKKLWAMSQEDVFNVWDLEE